MSIELRKAAQDLLQALTLCRMDARLMHADDAQRLLLAGQALRAAIQQAEAAAGGLVARVDYSERGNIAWLFGQQLPDGTELFKHPAPGVPEFSRIAKRKLDELQEQGFAITGYAIQRGPVRGFIDGGGFVGWWQCEPDPGMPDDVARDAERWRYAIADSSNQSMNFIDIFDDWDGDGSFVDAFDAAMLAAK